MKKNIQKTNWIVDAMMFFGFLICITIDVTGLSLHQWLGAIGGVLIVYHTVLHWDWVAGVTRRLFGRTSAQARLYYILDAAILSACYLIVVTGLFMSTWLDLPMRDYSAWKDFHEIVSLVALGMIVLKIGLHWRWIISVARRSFTRRAMAPAPLPQAAPSQAGSVQASASAAPTMSRREFLKLMGIVSAASLAAVAFTFEKQQIVLASNEPGSADPLPPAPNQAGSSTPTTVAPTATEPGTASSAALMPTTDPVTALQPTAAAQVSASPAIPNCVIRCDKHCAYPGDCRKYQDTNNNGYCDLGECI